MILETIYTNKNDLVIQTKYLYECKITNRSIDFSTRRINIKLIGNKVLTLAPKLDFVVSLCFPYRLQGLLHQVFIETGYWYGPCACC